jgi:hypothetical protein
VRSGRKEGQEADEMEIYNKWAMLMCARLLFILLMLKNT